MSTELAFQPAEQPLILVVDDNLEFLDGVKLTLEMEGYRVWTAANGQQALDRLLAAFRRDRAQAGAGPDHLPDLILADIMMPEMDGYAFYEQVRANPYLNQVPFIFLTAKSSEVDVRFGKELGIDDYLTKPFSPEDLLASVRGKLKRVEQQRVLAAQFTGDITKPTGVVVLLVIVIVLILLIVAAFWLGRVL
jgi:CRP/FNR family cyclic AMP-dependent transcriptional regulator